MNIQELEGLVLTSVKHDSSDEILFTAEDGRKFKMYHSQDCCESVDIEDIQGELDWLVNAPILSAYEETNSTDHPDGAKPEYEPESFTWTFYRFTTIKGTVVIRWYGSSNGYYSERVDFEEMTHGPVE